MGFITEILKKAGKLDMSRVRRQRNGTYTDANGKVIFSNGKMDSRAKLYLTGKYGRDYANRAEANMRSGNIYDSRNKRADGKIVGWRIDNGRGRDSSWNKEIANKAMKDKVADNRVRTDGSGRYMFRDKKTGLWTYFNQDAKDAAVARNNAKVNAKELFDALRKQGSLGRVVNNYTEGIANAGKSALEGVAHTVINPFRLGWDAITGNYDSSRAARYLTEPMGDFARAGLSLVGAQAAPLGETLNQLGVADTVNKYGKVFDTNQWLGTIAGGGTPWADENKGLETAANRWGWGDETKKAVGNITDSANLAAMLLGTKGATGAARAIGRMFKRAPKPPQPLIFPKRPYLQLPGRTINQKLLTVKYPQPGGGSSYITGAPKPSRFSTVAIDDAVIVGKKGGKMLQKFQKGKKIKSSYVKNQPITRTWVNDGKDFANLYNLNPRGRISGTSNWDLGRIAALADPNSTILMKELGLNLNSTTLDILKAMLNYASRANLKFSNINDNNFVDNKWGNQTLSAWNLLLTYVNNLGNLSNYQATNPMPQRTYIPSITRSAWDYSRGVGNLGFNNYAGLVNFVKRNANHGFARDLVNRFGAVENWKLADIENALGVSGRYGRGFLGSGDFTNMLKSMAKWAGENDAKYDNRFNAPKKKTSTFNASDLVRKANAIKLDKTIPKLSFAKQGAKLPSRSVVERFKESKSFRLGEG